MKTRRRQHPDRAKYDRAVEIGRARQTLAANAGPKRLWALLDKAKASGAERSTIAQIQSELDRAPDTDERFRVERLDPASPRRPSRTAGS